MRRNVKIVVGLIVSILLVSTLFLQWGYPGAIYPSMGSTATISGDPPDTIIVHVDNTIQNYDAFFDGGSLYLITNMNIPDRFEDYDIDSIAITYTFESCGFGQATTASLDYGNGPYTGKVIMRMDVPATRLCFETSECSYSFSCSQEEISQMNPTMQVSGSAMFTREIDPCEVTVCEPIEQVCDDSFVSICQPSCDNGQCTVCIPDCTDHKVEPEPYNSSNIIFIVLIPLIIIVIGYAILKKGGK